MTRHFFSYKANRETNWALSQSDRGALSPLSWICATITQHFNHCMSNCRFTCCRSR